MLSSKTFHFITLQIVLGGCTLEKPVVLHFFPDASFANKDDKEKESPENITEVSDSEEDINRLIRGARSTVVVVNYEVNTLDGPENTKSEEQFQVEKLEKKKYFSKCTIEIDL